MIIDGLKGVIRNNSGGLFRESFMGVLLPIPLYHHGRVGGWM